MLKCRKQSKIINKMIQNPHTSFDHLTSFKVISKWCTVLSLYRCYQVRNLIISNRTCDIIRSKKRINNQRITKLLKRVSIIKYIKGQWSQKMFFYLSSSRRWALHLLPPRVFRHHMHGWCRTLRAWNLQMYTKHRTWYVHCKKNQLKQHIVEINFSAEVLVFI